MVVKAIMFGILYLILMIIFVLFYMHDQLKDFFEARTTITSKIVQAHQIEFPTIIICMNPARKLSKAQKYGFKESDDLFYKEVPNSTLDQRQLELGYQLNKDYEIVLNQQLLKEGNNNMLIGNLIPTMENSTETFSVKTINTHYDGICSKIQPEFMLTSLPFAVTLNIKMNQTLDIQDVPKDYVVYLTSKNSWFGIIYQLWPQGPPAKVKIGSKSGNTMLRATLSESKYLKGREGDTLSCLESAYDLDSCELNCDYLNNMPNLPACQTIDQLMCIFQQFSMDQILGCFSLKQSLNYNVHALEPQSFYEPNSSLVTITIDSMAKEVKEEVKIISMESFIGNLGGSLGMFFGFSLSGWMTILLAKFIDKIIPTKQND